MSEVVESTTPSTSGAAETGAAETDVAVESAYMAHNVVSPHGEHEAVTADNTEQVDVIPNGNSAPLNIADLETIGALSSSVDETTPGNPDTAYLEPDSVAQQDIDKQDSTKVKPLVSVKSVPSKSNSEPPTPLVKKIINSGTFGAGAVGKVPPTKPTGLGGVPATKPVKPAATSSLLKSTSSASALTKAPMTSTRPPVTAAPQSRRLSVVPTKPTAPPVAKSSLSASASAKPSHATSKPVATSTVKATNSGPSTKPTPPTSVVRPSVVSPTGSATSATSRPKASVSEGVKRSATTRQSLPTGSRPPLASSAKPPVSRSSPSATATKPSRATSSISSIREVKEDSKVLEELQSQLKNANESLASKSEVVAGLESRVDELASSLEAVQTELASKSALAEQLDKDRSSLENQLLEAKDALVALESGQRENESILSALRQDADAVKVSSTVQEEKIRSLQTHILVMETEAKATQDSLEILQSSNSSKLERVAQEHEALLKATAATYANEIEGLKATHSAAAHDLDIIAMELKAKSASVNSLTAQIVGLKEEKEENSGKLSELEIEVLELKESQEANEEERERLLARTKALEEEVAKATAATQQAYEYGRVKEVHFAEELEELQKTKEAALKAESEKRDALNTSLEALKVELAGVLAAQGEIQAEALASVEVHNRKLQEAEKESMKKQAELSEEIKRITVELENQESYYASKVDTVKDEHSQLIKEAFERAKAEAGDAHAQELQALRATSASSIEQIQTANRSAFEDLKAEHASTLESEVNRLEKVIATLKLDLKATQDDLVKAKAGLETARSEVENLTQQRDEARVTASLAPDSAAHSEEIARLTKELSITKDDLTTANEMLNLTKISLTELSNNQSKDLEDAAKGRAEEVTKLRVAHEEEVNTLVAQKSELAVRVSDLEGELVTLQATIASVHATPKTNGNGAVPPVSPGVTKEELQRLYEAHNLKMHDLAAEHEKAIKALKDELEVSHNKSAELNAEVQRKVMEIQYLEQDQEESQDQITRLTEERDALLNKEQATAT